MERIDSFQRVGIFIASLAVIFSAPLAHAGSWWGDMFDVQDVVIEKGEVEEDFAGTLSTEDCGAFKDSTLAFPSFFEDITLEDIVNIGQEIWKIVEAGKPVVNVTKASANALPRGVTCWDELENWQRPKSVKYSASYRNGFGWEVVRFDFRLKYTAGGSHEGRGAYLTNVSVLPDPDVLWGYDFKAEVKVDSIVNLGTKADPIAGMEISVNWIVKTIVKESQKTVSFFVDGHGGYEEK